MGALVVFALPHVLTEPHRRRGPPQFHLITLAPTHRGVDSRLIATTALLPIEWEFMLILYIFLHSVSHYHNLGNGKAVVAAEWVSVTYGMAALFVSLKYGLC